MTSSELLEEKRLIEATHGEWTAHNIHLGDDIYTMGAGIFGDEVRLRRIIQVVADVTGRPLAELRILDLACLEGLFAIEFARHGARVVGIEGRRANLEKCLFAARVLGLDNAEFRLDDVRNVDEARYGRFDVVLCLGILYHMDDPGYFDLVEKIAALQPRCVVFDTRISLQPERVYTHAGHAYHGMEVTEHAQQSSYEEKQSRLWSSLDNAVSIKLTRRSLFTLLWRSGFTSVFECHVPQEPFQPRDRFTLAAVRGTPAVLKSCPQLPGEMDRELPESTAFLRRRLRDVMRRIGLLLPAGLKDALRRLLGLRVMDWTRPSVRGRRGRSPDT